MKIFILEYVDHLTERYHSDGGMVIIAKDLSQAKELISNDEYCNPTDEEWSLALVYDLVSDSDPKVFIFPDAGCC